MVLYVSQVDSFKHDKNKDAEYCSKSRTCTKCAEKPSCSWSLERQTCVNTTRMPEVLVVNIREHCPQFTIVDSIVNKMHLPFTYKVEVSNDLSGFLKYLGKSNITCSLRGVTYNGTVGEESDTINCESINNDNHLEFDKQRLMIYHYSIAFNGVPLRFDDGVNNYFTVYDRHYCDIADKNKDCVACSWDSELHTFYYKRCSAANMCTGLFEFTDGRNATSFEDTMADDQYNEDTIALLPGSGPSATDCKDMKIQSVEPLSAPWSGGTMLVITIKNHDVLSESRKVTVTVAGRDCVYPKTVNDETISCTVGPPKPNASVTGPVHVEYGPLRLTSAQTFQFVLPEPIGLSPTCGPVSGGTLLHITGRSLDASSTATVSVGPANVPCELIARYEDRVLCVTGPSNGPAAGAVTIVFDKFLRKKVGVNSTTSPSFKPVQFMYAGDPVLDAGQPFSGIASGGTYIPVRGRHLACVSNATLYVDDPDGVRHYAGCAVHNDTFMECRSPAIKAPRPKITAGAVATTTAVAASLNFGFRVRFADHTLDLSPQPDFPGYRLYADPVFTDFETNGRNVTINGRRLDRGYRPSVDLTIRLRNAKGTPCTVIKRQRRRIVCLRPLSSSANGELSEIYITVGHELGQTVKKKNTVKRLTDGPLGVFDVFLLIVGIITGVFFMSMLAVAVYVVWNNKWNIRRYL